jgi:hypothetical protein
MIVRMEIETEGVTTRIEREYEPEFLEMRGDTSHTAIASLELPALDEVTSAVATAAVMAHRLGSAITTTKTTNITSEEN